MADLETKYCVRCGKVMKITDFYSSNNKEKYPDGRVDLCKPCFVAHLDNWDPETYLPLLQEVDVPQVPDEWNSLLAKQAANPEKMTATTIIGKQLSKMKLKKWNQYRWADTENLQKLKEKQAREQLEKQGKSASEIDEIIAAGASATVQRPEPPQDIPSPVSTPSVSNKPSKVFTPLGEQDLGFELTDEDINYLRLKWGNTYRPFEWVTLEKLYQDMMASYDIQTAGHIDTLKMICKTSLKANQLLDIGDVQGALQMTKAYDTLMKSGKFTAAQNKAESGEYVDSIAEIAMMCEKQGFIPRFYEDQPNDKVDWVIKDNQNYAKKLITEEMNLGDMLDRAIRQIEEDKTKAEDAEADDGSFEEELFSDENTELTDEDLIKFREFEEELELKDKREIAKNDKKVIWRGEDKDE